MMGRGHGGDYINMILYDKIIVFNINMILYDKIIVFIS